MVRDSARIRAVLDSLKALVPDTIVKSDTVKVRTPVYLGIPHCGLPHYVPEFDAWIVLPRCIWSYPPVEPQLRKTD